MDHEPEKTGFPLVVWTVCVLLGALHFTESSALSGRVLPEPFTRPSVVFAQAKMGTMTPVSSRHSRGARVKRFESRLKNFFFEPLGQWLGGDPQPLPRKV